MNNDPRHIENGPEMNQPKRPGQSGYYTTASGDIEATTVEYVIDLLNKTVDNPNQTVSKGKLKHIAAQLLARNAMVERNNDVLAARVAELETELADLLRLANTTSVTLDLKLDTTEARERMAELVRTGSLVEQCNPVTRSLA